jgi:hypothetical protein
MAQDACASIISGKLPGTVVASVSSRVFRFAAKAPSIGWAGALSGYRSDSVCREVQASMGFLGTNLKPDSVEYAISSWTKNGIVADITDDKECGVAHRLSN